MATEGFVIVKFLVKSKKQITTEGFVIIKFLVKSKKHNKVYSDSFAGNLLTV